VLLAGVIASTREAATVKILQVTAPTESAVLDVPIPTPGEGEVLMRVVAVTTCPQWDLHLRHNEPMFVGHQFVYPYAAGQPGHEATGYIEEVGAGVTGLKPGDRVCAWRDAGHERPGCYAQYVVHAAGNVIPVPEGPPPEGLASLELAMCLGAPLRDMRRLGAIAGRSFGVFGLGPAGLVALQMARAEGAREVIGFDPLPQRRDLALKLGADACFDPTADIAAELPPRNAGARLQTSIDCVGARASVQRAMDLTGDCVALFGVQREEYTYALAHAGLTVCGYKGHFRESAQYALDLIVAGKLDLAPLVTHRLPLERYGEGIALLEAREAIKICFMPWG
jgi:threonine dehydrogenase-like Zn-dependent dehydrogenase